MGLAAFGSVLVFQGEVPWLLGGLSAVVLGVLVEGFRGAAAGRSDRGKRKTERLPGGEMQHHYSILFGPVNALLTAIFGSPENAPSWWIHGVTIGGVHIAGIAPLEHGTTARRSDGCPTT